MNENASMRIRSRREDAKGPVRREVEQVGLPNTPQVVVGGQWVSLKDLAEKAESFSDLQENEFCVDNQFSSKRIEGFRKRRTSRKRQPRRRKVMNVK